MLTLADYLATLDDYEGKQAVAPVIAVLDLFGLNSADQAAVAEADQLAERYWPNALARGVGRRQLLVAAAACLGRMAASLPDDGRPAVVREMIEAIAREAN